MKLNPIYENSPFISALKDASEFRRTLTDEGQFKRTPADDLCDSGKLLAELVNQCFWASIHVEEGRSVLGAICICSPEQAPRSRSFEKPVTLSVKSLVALLTASPNSPLAIHVLKNNLEIWGILDAIPMFTLKLRVAGTGTVVASDGNNVIAVLERGEIYLPKRAGDTDWIMIVANALDKNKSFPDRMKVATRFQQIVVAMHRQGHGGALVIVPASRNSWMKHVSFSFRFNSSSSLSACKRLHEFEEAQKLHEKIESGNERETLTSLLPLYAQSVSAQRDILNSLLRTIGELSAIDGAIIMDEELKLYGFGAKLQGEPEDFKILVLDALSSEVKTISYTQFDGTRHQSAARFVYQNPETMAFVASQDGRLTLIAWVIDRGQIAAIRRLEHFVWECP
jgi:hypothetical protein